MKCKIEYAHVKRAIYTWDDHDIRHALVETTTALKVPTGGEKNHDWDWDMDEDGNLTMRCIVTYETPPEEST